MTKGKAHGVDREYQELARDIIRHLQGQEELTPYEGDGIDVAIPLGYTTVTFDVVLKSPEGRLIVVECKRWNGPIEQALIYAFSAQVDHLRKELGVEVAGIFVTKRRYRSGAERAAASLGIDVAVCDEGQSAQTYVFTYRRYDPERDRVRQDICAGVTDSISVSATFTAVVQRSDGSTEEGKFK